MVERRKTMGFWEALWAIVGGLLLAGMLGLDGPAWLVLTAVVIYFTAGALYWKVRLAQQRRQRGQTRA